MQTKQVNTNKQKLIPKLQAYVNVFLNDGFNIPESRKKLLNKIVKHIENQMVNKEPVNLIFICTHNSRRSHFGQIWAQTASMYYKIPNINCFSGGTEETSLNERTISALVLAGF